MKGAKLGMDKHFLVRKIHSLFGIIPVGLFLLEHLFTNSFAAKGAEAFNEKVEFFQSLPYLLTIETLFIFLPIVLHGIYGLWIYYLGDSNVTKYGYFRNWTYLIQRLSGLITFIFILYHVYITRLSALFYGTEISFAGMHEALSNPWMAAFYLIGLLAAVHHFSNGIWTFLVSWGITIGTKSQRISAVVCNGIFVVLAYMGISALLAFING